MYEDSKTDRTREDNESEVLDLARKRADIAKTYWGDNLESAEKSLQMLNGDQWSDADKAEREDAGSPCLTNNVLPTFVDIVTGDQKQQRTEIKVRQTGFQSVATLNTQELNVTNSGGKPINKAKALSGLIRQIEYNSDAETQYDQASEQAAQAGFGFVRVRMDYVDDMSFDQHAIIEHIPNQFNVLIDPLFTQFDASDMGWGFIDSEEERTTFEKMHPNISLDVSSLANAEGWVMENTVRISEYFEVVTKKKKIYLMSDGSVIDQNKYEEIGDELLEKDITPINSRIADVKCVIWRKMVATAVIEGPTELKCTSVPIIPFWGKLLSIKEKRYYRGVAYHAHDAQIMANYWDSVATETVALYPKAPWVGLEGHTEGNHKDWEDVNRRPKSILTYKPQFQGDPGPRRQEPPTIPVASLNLGMTSVEKIKSTIGLYDASLGNVGGETSGRAIIARQQQGDRGTFTFVDNRNKAIRRVGKLLVEMLVNYYDTERVERIRYMDDTEDVIVLNKLIYDDEGDKWVTTNSFQGGKYEVAITSGPSYDTQRIENANSLLEFAKIVNKTSDIAPDLIAQNLDIPVADELAMRFKKTIDPRLLSAAEQDKLKEEQGGDDNNQPPEPPPPELILEQLKHENEQIKLKTEQIKAQTQALDSQTELKKAQLEAQHQNLDQASLIRELVAEAVAEEKSTQAPSALPQAET